MRVMKVLNNSLILALDDAGRETILMGKGIGYNKSIGHYFVASEIEKVFVLKDKSILNDIVRLSAELDPRYFEIAKQIIDYAIDKYNMKLMDHIYLGLTDHISYAVRRDKEGIKIHNFYTSHIKQFNKQEYEIGIYAVELMNKELNTHFSHDEVGNIAFHFIDGQQDNPYDRDNQKMIEIVNGILNIVKYHFQIVYDENGIAYTRFINHLRLFSLRMLNQELLFPDSEDFLYTHIVEMCSEEFECVKKIGIYIKERLHIELPQQEALYLTIHIHRILQE